MTDVGHGLQDTWENRLRSAAEEGNVQTVRNLLKTSTTDVRECAAILNDALHWAARCGRTETVCVLLAHKADVHACGSYHSIADSDVAVRWAAWNDYPETVRVLLKAQANCSVLPSKFVRRHMAFLRANHHIENLGFCLRLGNSILRAIVETRPCSLFSFESTRDAHVGVLSTTIVNCRDLCELVLSYV